MSSRSIEGIWGNRGAQWYSEALEYSDYADKMLAVMEPILEGCTSLLDVGAGCGALSIPLARILREVVALDPSTAMLDELRRKASAAGVTNIRTVASGWEQAQRHLGQFDVILCANVPNILDDASRNIPLFEQHARRDIFIVRGTPKNSDKFFFQELWPLICENPYPAKRTYFETYRDLYAMNVFANVIVANYSFDQPLKDVDDAVLFWKHHMGLKSDQWDEMLREFLRMKLQPWAGRLWASVPKQSAVIWWHPEGKTNKTVG